MKATRIRAITIGVNLAECSVEDLVSRLTAFYNAAEQAYRIAHFPVQTRRLILPPMRPTDPASYYQVKSTVGMMSRIAEQAGIRWLCLPIAGHTQWSSECVQMAINLINLHPNLFLHFMVAEDGHISSSLPAVAARTILATSRLSSNGYDNFRVGVGANIRPNTPYFPFSYQEGNEGFSLAVELIEYIIQIVKQMANQPLDRVRERLIDGLMPIVQEIDAIGYQLERDMGMEYKGQDISIAPFPDEVRSVAALIEMLGPVHCGQSGTLIITSLLTDVLRAVIQRTNIRHAGFNGVMFSLLEDCQLAKANNQRHLSMEKLLTYSSVCGCGIDMVPIPGDTFEDELTNLILDMAALSTVLNKPLGVRVLPIPMKAVNELTNFNHDFLTNTRIMRIDGQRLALPLSLGEAIRYLRFDK